MRIILVLLSALAVGVGNLCAAVVPTDSVPAARMCAGSPPEAKTYEDAKPSSLQGEKPEMPLIVDAGALKLTFSGYAQSSFTYQKSDEVSKNGFVLDRLILMMDAQIIKKVRMFVMFDAKGSTLHEMYGQYDFRPELKVRMGRFKQPFLLENITSPTKLNNLQINPMARYFAGLSGDPGIGNGGAGRDLGLMLTGDLFPKDGRRLVNYSIGVFNGNYRRFDEDNNTQKDVVGMVNYLPSKQWMLTCSFLLGTGHAVNGRPGVFSSGDNYRRRRIAGGFEWTGKPAHVRSEYVYGVSGKAHEQGVYVSADIHLPANFDIVANYDYLDTDITHRGSTVAGYPYANNRTHTFVGGLSYKIYKLCRVVTEYSYTMPDAGPAIHAWQTQLQVRF